MNEWRTAAALQHSGLLFQGNFSSCLSGSHLMLWETVSELLMNVLCARGLCCPLLTSRPHHTDHSSTPPSFRGTAKTSCTPLLLWGYPDPKMDDLTWMERRNKQTFHQKHQLSHFALLSRLLHGTRSSLVFISSMLSWKESDWLGYDKRRTQASHVCDTYFILHWSASMLLYHIPLIQDSLYNKPTLQERKGSHSFFNKVNMVLYDREKQTDKKEGSLFSQSEFWNGHSLILSL